VEEGLTFKEESGLVGNKITGKVLTGVCETGDECSSSINTPEQIQESGATTHLSFNLDSSLNHGEDILGVLRAGTVQSLNGS
jgi:hypothetical protein